MSILTKIFGDPNKRFVDKYRANVERVNGLEKDFEVLPDEGLKAKTQEFRKRLNDGAALDDLLPEAFAACREAAKRTIGQRHFDAQLIGGMVLHQGKVAEMKTGEGKTLAATLAAYLNALEDKGVHIVTVNDYLSKRDANWMGSVYHMLGLSVGCIQHEKSFIYEPRVLDKNEVTVEMENLREVPRSQAYAADITYGTNNEFGFDYLRDNMVGDLNEMAQRGHHFAIVDEVDSILIDEARTPLIISAPDEESTKLYETFARIAPQLKENIDYNLDEKMRTSILTEAGIEKVEKILGMGNIYTDGGVKYVHHLEQALRAQTLFKLDRNYVVNPSADGGEVIIVDEFTGRLMQGRRYSEGLHQAIEAKEGVKVQKESRTLATITFQNYFRMYKKLAGMTGTALTSAEELSKVYNLEVVAVPTNKPMARTDAPDSVYRTERGKFQAVAQEIKKRHELGQPVLVGTVSIEKNELLGQFLKREGIPHEILNAKNHEREAQIIANAGKRGAVTIATNMAGRGVDIILGGRDTEAQKGINPPQPSFEKGGGSSLLQREDRRDLSDSDWQCEHDEIINLGGLCIIGTERHEARRIDDQLRGRAGRQGDPGFSRFFVSLEDDLMRIFAPDKIKRMMEFLKVPEDQPIENSMISRAIENAQAKIEGFNFDTRKHVLEYDDVMNKQRETIYRKRREALETTNMREQVFDMIADEISRLVKFHAAGDFRDDWNLEEIREAVGAIFTLPADIVQNMTDIKTRDGLADYLVSAAKSAYEAKEKQAGEEAMRQIEKIFYLRTLDMFWMDHLDEMEHLRDSVRLRAYGQKDPLVEYKNEGHHLFARLLGAIQASFVGAIYKIEMGEKSTDYGRQTTARNTGLSVNAPLAIDRSRLSVDKQKVGRNDPCWCGSGKKFKKCHGA